MLRSRDRCWTARQKMRRRMLGPRHRRRTSSSRETIWRRMRGLRRWLRLWIQHKTVRRRMLRSWLRLGTSSHQEQIGRRMLRSGLGSRTSIHRKTIQRRWMRRRRHWLLRLIDRQQVWRGMLRSWNGRGTGFCLKLLRRLATAFAIAFGLVLTTFAKFKLVGWAIIWWGGETAGSCGKVRK